MYTDDLALETSASDIRVFGKWSGAEIQISDMSLEVIFFCFSMKFFIRIKLAFVNRFRITFSEQRNRNFFLIPQVVIK